MLELGHSAALVDGNNGLHSTNGTDSVNIAQLLNDMVKIFRIQAPGIGPLSFVVVLMPRMLWEIGISGKP